MEQTGLELVRKGNAHTAGSILTCIDTVFMRVLVIGKQERKNILLLLPNRAD